MFFSIRARIVALCVAIVVVALAANAVLQPAPSAAALQGQAVSLASAVTQFKLD